MAQWSVTYLLGRQQNSSHRENVDSYFSHWSMSAAGSSYRKSLSDYLQEEAAWSTTTVHSFSPLMD